MISGRIFDKATQSFLGSPTSALYLSLLRILIPLWCLLTDTGSYALSVSHLDHSLYIPTSFYKLLPGFLSADMTHTLLFVFKTALVFLMLGLASRIAAFICFILGSYLLGLSYNLGYSAHNINLLPFIFLALSFSPCSDYLSLSRLIFGRKIHSVLHYSVPVHFIRILLIFVYVSAAFQKIREGDWGFVTTEHLAIKLAQSGMGLSLWLSQFTMATQTLAALAIVVQLLSPLALWWRTRYFAFVVLIFQLGTSLIGAHFTLYPLLFVLWIPFRELVRFTPIFNETNPPPLLQMKSAYLYGAIILTFITCSILRYEAWPFSHFPMYSDTSYIENGLVRYRLKIKQKDRPSAFLHKLSKNEFNFPASRVHAYFRKQEKLENIDKSLEALYWSLLKNHENLEWVELCRQEWLPVTAKAIQEEVPCVSVARAGEKIGI